jgi:transposase-like protein
MSTKRKKYDGNFKAKIAMEAILQTKTIAEISSEYKIHSSQIMKWKKEFKENAGKVFGGDKEMKQILKEKEEENDRLYKQIGILTVERDFLKKKSEQFAI